MDKLSLAGQAGAISRVVERQAARRLARIAGIDKARVTCQARREPTTEAAVLLILGDGAEHCHAELRRRCDLSPQAMNKALVKLISEGRVERRGTHQPYRYILA